MVVVFPVRFGNIPEHVFGEDTGRYALVVKELKKFIGDEHNSSLKSHLYPEIGKVWSKVRLELKIFSVSEAELDCRRRNLSRMLFILQRFRPLQQILLTHNESTLRPP